MLGQQTEKITLGQALAAELKKEAVSTRKMLERFPDGHADWQPHEKSMSLGRLASHVAELPMWVGVTIKEDELDFAKTDYKPAQLTTAAELVEHFDKNLNEALQFLQTVEDEALMHDWRLRNGDQIYFEMPKMAVIRSMAFNHLYHHRGQLSVYLRLKDVPLPGAYGPSADEPII